MPVCDIYVKHKAAQIRQAGADGKAAILTALARNQELAIR